MAMRKEKVAERIKQEVSEILQREMRDPRVGFVTITRVVVSDDLRMSRIHYSILGSEQQKAEVKKALEAGKKFVRRLLGERLKIRYTPEIHFTYDRSPEYSIKVEQIFEQIHREQEARQKPSDEQPEDS